jgi:hypothetical protein
LDGIGKSAKSESNLVQPGGHVEAVRKRAECRLALTVLTVVLALTLFLGLIGIRWQWKRFQPPQGLAPELVSSDPPPVAPPPPPVAPPDPHVDGAAKQADNLQLVARLIWGINGEEPGFLATSRVDAKLERKLRQMFRWENYYVVTQKTLSVNRRILRA